MSETKQEAYKRQSDGLRGNIAAELSDETSAFVSDDSYELLKFFGSYQGYDRDTATPRKKQGLDKEWEFMLRLKIPAGRLKAEQYLALDKYCDVRANGSLRITTRQTLQFHQIVKKNLKPFVADISKALLSTLGGCGDVVRNVTTCPAPIQDGKREVMTEFSYRLAQHFAPKTEAYWDIFLDGEKLDYPFNPQISGKEEPIYGDTYMPRKFKISVIEPEDNCTDALSNDLAMLALFEDGELKGYNVAVGGGMGMKHNTPSTYPRLATPVAFVKPQDALAMAESVVKLQRDYGDRQNRQHARLKYVVEEKGLDWVRETLSTYFGQAIELNKPMPAFAIEDHMGWHEQGDGKWFLGLHIPSGRIIDIETGLYAGALYRSALRAVIAQYQMNLVLTADQNIILCDIEEGEKAHIEQILRDHGIRLVHEITHLARHFHACVSLPTCGKGLAESERVEIPLVRELEKCFAQHGLDQEEIAVRIAGCPNGCSRPYGAEIGIVGRMPGHYVLYIGGEFNGTRLGHILFDKVPLEEITAALDPLLARYAQDRKKEERLGDYCERTGLVEIKQAILPALSEYKWAA